MFADKNPYDITLNLADVSDIFYFFSGRGWGKGGDVRADGRGFGFY